MYVQIVKYFAMHLAWALQKEVNVILKTKQKIGELF